jgi:predicted nucleic-acid-binding Zn-ribbon protein
MDQNRLNQVVEALQKKGVNKPCPRCGNARFSVVGETLIPLQDNPNAFQFGGPSIPTVIVACDNCGYITQHASVPLGIALGNK